VKFLLEIEVANDDLKEHIADRRRGQSKKEAYIEILDCILNGLSCIDAMILRVSGGHIPLVIGAIKDISGEDADFVEKLLKEKENK